jgi:nitrite reductase/ring-hydroxylating ferredoxin subunit/uncharacterized membrane protein
VVVTDVPIGALTVSIIADLIGQPLVADVAMLLGVLAMIASAVTGAADYVDVDGKAGNRATVHSTLMVVALVVYAISLAIRAGDPAVRALPIGLAIVGYLILTIGANIGGDLVFLIGTNVNRHAWRGAGTKWIALDLGALPDIPQGGPTKLKAGINELAVIRDGDRILAIHAVCAHAGGPMADGTVVGGDRLECPWHGSRYLLANGHVVRGPAAYDQPAYEVRRAESGGWEARRRPT